MPKELRTLALLALGVYLVCNKTFWAVLFTILYEVLHLMAGA